MFDDIGEKIKNLAVIGCLLGIAASVIGGILLITQSNHYNPTATAGWTILIAGSLGSWIGSFMLYGFGELVEKTCENNAILVKMEKKLQEVGTSAPENGVKAAPADGKPDLRKRAPAVPAAGAKAAAAVSKDNTSCITDEMLQRIQQMASAKEIYTYLAAQIDDKAILAHIKGAADAETLHDNRKASAVSTIESYIKHNGRVFPVDRSSAKMACPVCGHVQQNTRKKCFNCAALFEYTVE